MLGFCRLWDDYKCVVLFVVEINIVVVGVLLEVFDEIGSVNWDCGGWSVEILIVLLICDCFVVYEILVFYL